MLVGLGLDSLAEAVYRAMLAEPDWGPDRLAGQLAVTETEIHQALDTLVGLALIRESAEQPGVLRPVDPGSALQALLLRQQQDIQQQQQRMRDSQLAVSRLVADVSRQQQDTPPEQIETIIGLDNVHRRLERLASEATSSAWALVPAPMRSTELAEAALRNDRIALARGVGTRTVFLDSSRTDEITLDYARRLTDAGGEVRTAPELPLRMLIVDGRTALVPMDTTETRRGAAVVRSPGAIAGFVALFEMIWSSSCPLGAGRGRDSDGLTAQDRQILLLVSQGLTDEATGHRLGLSLRTVRRAMAGIMEALEARSRFEAGLKAAQRGWL
jgi:DNA-binding CsgD family transcriptional regulator/sugar-specific transcriptional regulator TrmB